MRSARPVLAAIALSLIFLIVYRRFVQRPNAARPGPNDPYTLQVHAIPVTHNLSLGDFEVPARGTHDVKIALDEPRMRNARLTGHFEASGGGSSGTIQVMLLNESEYNRFTNHSTPSQFLYLSKSATNGNIEAAIPRAGIYYLVFDNSSSSSSIKVNADVTVHFETVQVDSQNKVR
jgi:hypothetical protein